jgi:muramoyltetrapeptide carboxypeptidase
MAPLRFPLPLRPGMRIAVTAPSSGVHASALPRLDLVIAHLIQQGFVVEEGACLRQERNDASAPAPQRAAELQTLLLRPDIAAVMPPWGGELATEVLDLLDFEALRHAEPKWMLGYSDVSTLLMPLTLVAGWGTAHGANLMDLAPTQTDPLTTATMAVLAHDGARPIRQDSSDRHQVKWIDFAAQVDAPLQLTEQTRWQRLDGSSAAVDFAGHLIGGCIDTLAWLAGTRYGDVPGFVRACGEEGAILYLENVEFTPPALVRALTALRRHGWFEGLAGVMLGRSAAPEPSEPGRLQYRDALLACLGDVPCPVLFDVCIGHRPPQFTIVNGALGTVRFEGGRGSLVQRWP